MERIRNEGLCGRRHEGLQLMHEGDKALLWIPEKLAYEGRDGSPRGMLVYEVQLLKVLN